MSAAPNDEASDSSPASQSDATAARPEIDKAITGDGSTAGLRGFLPWVLAAAIVVAAQATVSLLLGPGDKLKAYTNVTLFLLILAATGAAALNAFKGYRGYRSFWTLYAVGMGIWALDQWMWIYYEFWLHTDVPNDSIGEPALFLHIVPLMAALAVRPHLASSSRRLHQMTFSFLLLLFFWVFLYAYYVFPYQFLIPEPSTYWIRYNSLYLCENLALLSVAGILILRSERPWKSVYAHLFGASALYAVISEQVNVAINGGGSYYVGGIYDWGFIAAASWFVLVAIRGHNIPLISLRPRRVSPRLAKYVTLLSILGVVMVPLLGIWTLYQEDTSLYLQKVHLLIILLFAIIFAALVCLQMYAANLDLQREVAVRLEAEKGLREAKVAAEAGSRAKAEFLANMSHEIRTPMNGVIGMTELALDTPLSPEQREYLTMVKDSGNALLTLLNDILDFSKIEAGKLSLDPLDFDLRDFLATSLKPIALRASQKGLEIAWRAMPGVPERVVGDAGRLRQVITNLVGNAIKFTERGEVVVDVDVESLEGESILLHFKVRDTGIGIAPEKQKAIFEAFTQADSSMTRKFGGTGLGLTISSRLVQMMGGNIRVESKVGEGTTFHFTARLGEAKPFAAESTSREVLSLRDLPVLVVDDNGTNRKILDAMLKHWLMRPEMAASGEEGLATLERAASTGTPFPLVLLDAQMPEMDGFALAEQIKQNPKLAGATIMMLTSAGQRGDAIRCRELGIAVYLIKPLRQSELLEAILAALGKAPGQEISTVITRHTLRENRRKLRILLAEDNVVNQQLTVRLLEKRGHIVTVASNGAEAVALVKKSPFDVVLMDVQMPEMNGFDATALIRKEEESTGMHLSIIAMTAHAMEGDRERCLTAGMDGYIAKPIKVEDFVETLENLGRSPQVAEVEATPEPNDLEPINAASALAHVGGDVGLLKELVGLFLNEIPELLTDLRKAVKAGDANAIERAAHKLKGSVGNFAARPSFEAALKLEVLGKDGRLSEAEPAYAELEREINRLQSAMAELSFKEARP